MPPRIRRINRKSTPPILFRKQDNELADINPNIISGQSDAQAFIAGGTLSSSQARQVSSSHGTESVVQDITQYQAEQSSIEILRFPLDTAKFFFIMSFQAYKRLSLLDVQATLNTENQVLLPVPLNIQDNHAISYTETPFNPFYGNFINQSFAGLEATFQSAVATLGGGQPVEGTGSGFLSGLAAVGSALPGALPATAAGLTADSLQAVQAFGYSPNQFVTVLLKGPNYKQHSFSWHLVPKNYDESIMIQRIIRILNNASAPGLEWGGSVFSFPSVVQCAFWPNYSYLFRFKPAVITRVAVNYNPGGVASFYHEGDSDGAQDNPPESIHLTLDFLELEYWLKNDFKEIGAIPTDTGVTATASERSGRIRTDEPRRTNADIGIPEPPGGFGQSNNVAAISGQSGQ